MRGENLMAVEMAERSLGSPPHARGKFTVLTATTAPAGITPACAGKMIGIRLQDVRKRDHPRMRGENSMGVLKSKYHRGSPPHARGKCHHFRRGSQPRGITPACAGKMSLQARRSPWSRDHPRMRGENMTVTSGLKCCEGSPPHARGKLDDTLSKLGKTGITPACAGKISVQLVQGISLWDHPRMRGENLDTVALAV